MAGINIVNRSWELNQSFTVTPCYSWDAKEEKLNMTAMKKKKKKISVQKRFREQKEQMHLLLTKAFYNTVGHHYC